MWATRNGHPFFEPPKHTQNLTYALHLLLLPQRSSHSSLSLETISAPAQVVSLNPLVFSYSPLCRQQPKRLLKNIKQMSYDANFFCSQEIRSKHHKAYKAYRIWPIATFPINLVPVSLFLQSDMLAFLLFSKYAIFTTISGQYLSIRKVFSSRSFLGSFLLLSSSSAPPSKERSFLTHRI